MAFATLIIKTNIGEVTATPLWYIARYILRLDKKTFAVFILSQIGGYPVGVRLLLSLIHISFVKRLPYARLQQEVF